MGVEHYAGGVFVFVVLSSIIASRILFAARTAVARRRAFAGSKLPAPTDTATGKDGHGRRQTRIIAILGSGGHTAEMLKLVSDLNIESDSQSRLQYITSDERSRKSVHYAHWVPRARYVGESFVKAAPRAFVSLLLSIWLLLRHPTDVILCNGPATGAVVCFSAIFLNALGFSNTRIIYLESVARVTSLSLTGKLLYPVAHRFLVQWPQLRARYPASEYHGRYT